MTKFLVGRTENIPEGKLKNITAGGKEIVVVNIKGNFYAISNICSHAGAELHEGVIDEYELTCPWHGAKWNVQNGNLVWFSQKLKNQESYKAIVEGENVFVEI